MKTKNLLTMIAIAVSMASLSQAQTLTEFKPKDASYGVKKAKGAKKIFISYFSVNYQIYNEKQKFKQGGSTLGGGMKGDAKAEASVGLEGLSDTDVQIITDKLYADYIAKIKSSGLQIITAEEAAKTETYSDYEIVTGGKVSLAQLPGVMATAPSEYKYFVKKIAKSGKEKSGGFLGNAQFLYPKLSKELDDAIIAKVDINVLFVEDKNAFQGNGVNIKIKTNLRLAANDVIMMTDDSKSLIKMKGQNTIDVVNSTVSFYHGKMGMGSTTSYVGTLGKPLYIQGVVADEKVQSFASGGISQGVSTMYGTYFSVRNSSSKATKVIPVNAKKFQDGVYMAASKFIDFHTSEFLNALK
ncbi:MAG TPA: hypothetical protein VFM79_02410 [Pelobium sp.]|nr:hypothetical protein [Pelobium sp.]